MIPGILIALIIHEYTKALVNHHLSTELITGPKPRFKTNLLRYVDPLGFLLMLFFGYGWAMPARLNPFAYRNRKSGFLIIFLMPFMVNIIIAATAAIAASYIRHIDFGIASIPNMANYMFFTLLSIARFSVSFALFNLVPIYPLDGNLLVGSLRPMWGMKIARNERNLQMGLALLILFGIAGMIFNPLVNMFLQALIF